MRGTNVVSLWETCINNQWKYYCLNHVTVPQVSTIMQLFLKKKKKKTIMQLRERKREKGEGLWCTYIAIYTIIATGWQQWLRKILVVLGCLQHEQPLQHQHCVATHFSPKSRATIRLKKKKLKTEEQSLPNEKVGWGGVSTWMLLWAKKGQNAEWKLTSTFFHPNCCNPRIISSV